LQARELLEQLRALADDPALHQDDCDPLTGLYRETTAMADTAIRMVQAFPDAPTAQLHLCEGLEAMVQVIAERAARITWAAGQRRQEAERLQTLAELLACMHAGQLPDLQPLVSLAKALLAEAQQAEPLRFRHARPEQPARYIASHSLTVAQVVARVVRHDAELRSQAAEAVLAALVHDVGMLGVPAEILMHPGALTDAQRRTVESHTRLGAQLATRVLPSGAWLAEAAGGHHERLDGTGYPAGLRGTQIGPLTRLLAVCDVYAALCCARPHRPPYDTRTALTDTLLLAEQGALDRQHAERLLLLSFYPVGTVVELADGTVAMVVATHLGRRDLNTPARPVLVLLTDAQGQVLPAPHHVDLAQCDNRSIVRTLRPDERRDLLGRRYPELV
jgi:HD-GYP domain-containing protein (c-di-GMP phosphodiesterase class II)